MRGIVGLEREEGAGDEGGAGQVTVGNIRSSSKGPASYNTQYCRTVIKFIFTKFCQIGQVHV